MLTFTNYRKYSIDTRFISFSDFLQKSLQLIVCRYKVSFSDRFESSYPDQQKCKRIRSLIKKLSNIPFSRETISWSSSKKHILILPIQFYQSALQEYLPYYLPYKNNKTCQVRSHWNAEKHTLCCLKAFGLFIFKNHNSLKLYRHFLYYKGDKCFWKTFCQQLDCCNSGSG